MAFWALVIGAVLVVAAIRDTQGSLFAALGQDVPGFAVWAAAIIALGAIGFVPNLKPLSRALIALVIVVIFLRNYQAILAGFAAVAPTTNAATNASGTGGNVAPRSGNVWVTSQNGAATDAANSFTSGIGNAA